MAEKGKNVLVKNEAVEKGVSRRGFLGGSLTAASFLAMSCASRGHAQETEPPLLTKAKGVILADATKCVGCRRCELACTEYNEGVSHPVVARIKIYRNLNFGPRGVSYGFWRREGKWGNGRIIQETCKQCAHPVPCALACPNKAIYVCPTTGARVINQDKCKGCGLCTRACPWEMPSLNPITLRSTKCHLCQGNPECVQACPAGALKYVPWRDLRDEVPIRQAQNIPAKLDCSTCHILPKEILKLTVPTL